MLVNVKVTGGLNMKYEFIKDFVTIWLCKRYVVKGHRLCFILHTYDKYLSHNEFKV